jgi:hypothetical protein
MRMMLSSLPTTFHENHRSYTLNISPEGQRGIITTSTERCLQVMIPFPDGTLFTIEANYREDLIGTGRYRKQGLFGQLASVETLEASGAMMGLLETALAQREAHQREATRAEQHSRCVLLPCRCGHEVGYDPQEQIFVTLLGGIIVTCEVCGTVLSLQAIEQSLQRRILALQAELRQQQDHLALVGELSVQWRERRRE